MKFRHRKPACSAQLLLITLLLHSSFILRAQATYYPPKDSWEQKRPEQLGVNNALLQKAIATAITAESKNPRSMEENHLRSFGREPFGGAIGPFADRGDQTGVIIYKGYCIAAWGEPDRCDMTHSVTKSFLSATLGLALDAGLIKSFDDEVKKYLPPIEIYTQGEVSRPANAPGNPMLLQPFADAHNAIITWDHLLRQTSNWRGTLWDKPDWADRPDKDANKWRDTTRPAPGTAYEYNDVRVNLLALAATQVWRQALPVVLKQHLMDKIGASDTWRWAGYRNAWIVLDGQPVQSVSGGGHWGGGMFINAWDMARFGYLTLRNGRWAGNQLLSNDFMKMATTPTPVNDDYGFMNYFLNTGKKMLPDAPESAFCHIGNGTNLVYVDREHDVVAVIRWIENKEMNNVIAAILKALPAN